MNFLATTGKDLSYIRKMSDRMNATREDLRLQLARQAGRRSLYRTRHPLNTHCLKKPTLFCLILLSYPIYENLVG